MAELAHDPSWPRAGGWADLRPDASGYEASVDLAILGVPAWRTSLSPTGAHATPAAIREALRRYSPALVGGGGLAPIDLDAACSFADAGDVDEPDGPEGEARTRAAVSRVVSTARVLVALGGDNSVTVPVATAGAQVAAGSLADAGLVTLDAHHDLRDGVSNGSPVRRLVEAGLDPARIVQIGIADFANSAAYARRARDLGITVVHRDDLHGRAPADVMAAALAIAGSAGGPVHLDIDVDVCDRSVAPGCPASVPGGLAAWELRALVRAAARDERVRTVDIAEVDATADAPDGRTVRLAALCVLEVAAGLAARPAASLE
ncbi:formimidoylglutamase [Agromyces intestinalis]|uniref:Formimidoylglutamase n=1 Tax=Agromyces intestinalis TaxID=2592652 RepID=A0A5C1YF87_9MICO|nr:arginase family protein [Agromyces intestinalis]QEO14826.1 formimidoylglutamase [Agromyces intestinalis]